MNEIVKVFEEHPVRILDQEGAPWFVVNDVCRILDIRNPRNAVARLDEDERASVSLMEGGQHRRMNVVSESGLYALILRSDKPAARAFRKWTTEEVLPSIRRTGGYVVPGIAQEALASLVATVKNGYKSLIESNARLREQVDYLSQYEPATEFGEAAANGKPRWLARRGCWVSAFGRKVRRLKPSGTHLQLDLFLDALPEMQIAGALSGIRDAIAAKGDAND